MLVFGTLSEAIKMCPLVNELNVRKNEYETVVTVTGQHREMLDQILRVFDIAPHHDLAIMKPGQTLFDVTFDVLLKFMSLLEGERPDVVFVRGDTTTSFVAALDCFCSQIPVEHVEAGLRVHDTYSPWPEEFNRQAVDIVSECYFAPTEASKLNLLSEGMPESKIWVIGTTVREGYTQPELEWTEGSRLILITAHSRENLGEPMHRMSRAIRRVMEEHPDNKVIYPIYMNFLVRKAAHEELDGFDRPTSSTRSRFSTSTTSWQRATSSSPIRAASRMMARAWASRCSSCATPPSAPRAWQPAR